MGISNYQILHDMLTLYQNQIKNSTQYFESSTSISLSEISFKLLGNHELCIQISALQHFLKIDPETLKGYHPRQNSLIISFWLCKSTRVNGLQLMKLKAEFRVQFNYQKRQQKHCYC